MHVLVVETRMRNPTVEVVGGTSCNFSRCGVETDAELNPRSWWHSMQFFFFFRFGEPNCFHDEFAYRDGWGSPTVLMSYLFWFI